MKWQYHIAVFRTAVSERLKPNLFSYSLPSLSPSFPIYLQAYIEGGDHLPPGYLHASLSRKKID